MKSLKSITLRLFFVTSLLTSVNALSQSNTFQVTVDLGASENACDLQQTPDGGFIVSGLQFNPSSGSMNVFLMKFLPDGTVQWTKTYGGAIANGANLYHNYRVINTGEGGYLVVGTTGTSGSNSGDVYVIKTDTNGDTLWTKTYGGANGDDGNSVFEASNGDYVIGGSFALGGQRRMGFIRIAPDGTLLRQGFLQDGIASPFFEYLNLSDNEIGVVHAYSSVLSVIDSSGALQWSMPFGIGSSYSVDALKTPNGEYVIFGLSQGLIGGGYQLMRANSSGLISLLRKFTTNSDESPRNMVRAADGNYVLFGLSTSMSGPSSLMACEVDTNGSVVWSNRYSVTTNANHEAGRIIRTSDGGYAMVGQHDRLGNFSDYDVYLVKTDSLGQSGCNQQAFTFNSVSAPTVPTSPVTPFTATLTNQGTYTFPVVGSPAVAHYNTFCSTLNTPDNQQADVTEMFPNPVKGLLHITGGGALHFTLMDMTGAEVLRGDLSADKTVDVSRLAQGCYSLLLTDFSGKSSRTKLIKVDF